MSYNLSGKVSFPYTSWMAEMESCHKILFQSQSICDRQTVLVQMAYGNEALNCSNVFNSILDFKMEGSWQKMTREMVIQN